MIHYLRTKIQLYHKRKFYAKFLRKGDLCFDVGANVGSKSKLFLSIGAKVVAVEPQKSCEQALEEIKRNDQKFHYLLIGLAAIPGHGKFYKSNINELSTFSEPFVIFAGKNKKVSYSEPVPTEVSTLDILIKQYGLPDYCKIDVEGYEEEVLNGLTHRIPYIEFEFIKELEGRSMACIRYLSGIGTVTFNMFQYESEGLIFSEWCSAEDFIKKIATLPSGIKHANIIAHFE